MEGIRDLSGRGVANAIGPTEALQWLTEQTDTMMVAWLFDQFWADPTVCQTLINAIPHLKARSATIAVAGPLTPVPPAIARFFSVLDYHLPGPADIARIQEDLGEPLSIPTSPTATTAAQGLTEFEIETAMAYSLVCNRSFDADIIVEQKKAMIRRTGLMEFFPPVPEDQVGGLTYYKEWLQNRKAAILAHSPDKPAPKAVLLLGAPGTGKSLTAKASASILGWPLIRLDLASLKDSLVGASEARMRQATATIDAFGRAVVWLDEIEKAIGGAASSHATDGGTTAGMMGHFLTWMQETTSPILVIATANDITKLPPEFVRAGRFDALFFVDLPNEDDRREIYNIMTRRYGYATSLESWAAKAKGWTGAEIEQAVKDGLYDGPVAAHAAIVPLAKTMREQIDALRAWAAGRARPANAPDATHFAGPRVIQA